MKIVTNSTIVACSFSVVSAAQEFLASSMAHHTTIHRDEIIRTPILGCILER
jgi:hypothetical protein